MKFITMLYKRARLFKELYLNKTLGRRAPVGLFILVTNRCQMRCSYCFVDHKLRERELSTQEVIDIIDEGYGMGTCIVCLMGGEPLMRGDIDVIVDHIISKGIICDITTNGLLIKDKLDVVKKADMLMVSLDGDEKANDLNRGKGSYKKILEGIKVARENGIVTRINTVLSKNNVDSINHILSLAKQYGMYVTFSITAEACGGSEKIQEMLLTDEETRDIYEKIKKLKSQGNSILFSHHTLDHVINYPVPYSQVIERDDEKHRDYCARKCMFGNQLGYVDSDGKIYPCATLWQTFKAKSILDVGLRQAWDNMQNLTCQTCSCPSAPEWDYLTSPQGILDGINFTIKQVASQFRREYE
jgi:MoaA/NifB/PqqE/SkfB family radical SAM enzyme